MPTVDFAAYIGVLVVLLLAVVFGELAYMRDPVDVAPRAVRRCVRCPRYGRTAMIELAAPAQSGMPLRRVRHCPLRCQGERCGEGCVWQPSAAS